MKMILKEWSPQMATRKKKTEGMILDMPGTLGTAKIVRVEPANQPSGGWPKINQGTHLTVKTYEDGRTELIWDDEQLLREVRMATSPYEYSEPKTTVNDDGSLSMVVTVTKKTKGKKNVSTQ